MRKGRENIFAERNYAGFQSSGQDCRDFFNLSKGNPQKVFSLTSHLNSWFELTAHYNVFVWESQK